MNDNCEPLNEGQMGGHYEAQQGRASQFEASQDSGAQHQPLVSQPLVPQDVQPQPAQSRQPFVVPEPQATPEMQHDYSLPGAPIISEETVRLHRASQSPMPYTSMEQPGTTRLGVAQPSMPQSVPPRYGQQAAHPAVQPAFAALAPTQVMPPSTPAYGQPQQAQPVAPQYDPDLGAQSVPPQPSEPSQLGVAGQAMQAAQPVQASRDLPNVFADPANASGTRASVTPSQGISHASAASPTAAPAKAKSIIPVAILSSLISAILVILLGMYAISSGLVRVPSVGSVSRLAPITSTGGNGSSTVSGKEVDWTAVAKSVSYSVVSIQAKASQGVMLGSGAVLDMEGHIITNNHVVAGATELQVTMSNGNIYEARLVGTDPSTDLAVIKLVNPPSDLVPVAFANSDDLAVGEAVMAIGSPLGYKNTATTGVVSALDRPVSVTNSDTSTTVVTNAVQIDAAINSGNSGGPTFNTSGKLIGINSSIATTGSSGESSDGRAGSIGIGFAIPSNLAHWVSAALIEKGSVTHVMLGVSVTSDVATTEGVTRAGARVQSVVSNGPAHAAGIQNGDTIVAFNGHAVGSSASLLGYVRATQVDTTVTVTVIRGGKTLDLNLTLDKSEEQLNATSKPSR